MTKQQSCRVCGCTDNDCRGCIALTGAPCVWIETDLCSACRNVEKYTLSDTQKDMLRAMAGSSYRSTFQANYKRMNGGKGISLFNRTAISLQRLRLIDYRGHEPKFAHLPGCGRGGWYVTPFGQKRLTA